MAKHLTLILLITIISCSYTDRDKPSSDLRYNKELSDSLTNVVLDNWRVIDTDTAILILEKAKTTDSTNWSAFANVSTFYLRKNDLKNYRKNYHEMTEFFPDYWRSYYELGLLKIFLEADTLKAKDYFTLSLEALKRDGEPKDESGKIEYQMLKAKLLNLIGEEYRAVQIVDSLSGINDLPKGLEQYVKNFQFETIDEQLEHLKK